MSFSLHFVDDRDNESVDEFSFNSPEDLDQVKASAARFYMKEHCEFHVFELGTDTNATLVAKIRFISDVELFFNAIFSLHQKKKATLH